MQEHRESRWNANGSAPCERGINCGIGQSYLWCADALNASKRIECCLNAREGTTRAGDWTSQQFCERRICTLYRTGDCPIVRLVRMVLAQNVARSCAIFCYILPDIHSHAISRCKEPSPVFVARKADYSSHDTVKTPCVVSV